MGTLLDVVDVSAPDQRLEQRIPPSPLTGRIDRAGHQ
jgi:hypothetical protein